MFMLVAPIEFPLLYFILNYFLLFLKGELINKKKNTFILFYKRLKLIHASVQCFFLSFFVSKQKKLDKY